jgi:hypothetical protein
MQINVREILDNISQKFIEEGKIRGVKKERIRIAKELLKKGIDINIVIALTDIDREKIAEYSKGMFDEKIRTAKEMSKRGFDIDTIIEVIALDRKKIEKLISTSNQ